MLYERPHELPEVTNEEVTDVRISHMNRHEFQPVVRDLEDVDYVLIEEAGGGYAAVQVKRLDAILLSLSEGLKALSPPEASDGREAPPDEAERRPW